MVTHVVSAHHILGGEIYVLRRKRYVRRVKIEYRVALRIDKDSLENNVRFDINKVIIII